jgi:hypothetical protein
VILAIEQNSAFLPEYTQSPMHAHVRSGSLAAFRFALAAICRLWSEEEATSLTFAVLDHLLDLPLHRLKVEGRRVHRRVFDCGLRQLRDVLLEL